MSILLSLLFLLVAVTGTGIVLSRRPGRQVLAMAANGLVLSLLFTALQAPDVAFSEIAVGTVAVPLWFLVVLISTRIDRTPRTVGVDGPTASSARIGAESNQDRSRP